MDSREQRNPRKKNSMCKRHALIQGCTMFQKFTEVPRRLSMDLPHQNHLGQGGLLKSDSVD